MPSQTLPPPDFAGPADPVMDDANIRTHFGVTGPTLRAWRRDRGFPAPCFYVGIRGYTRQSRIAAWIEQQPKVSSQAGRQIGERDSLARGAQRKSRGGKPSRPSKPTAPALPGRRPGA